MTCSLTLTESVCFLYIRSGPVSVVDYSVMSINVKYLAEGSSLDHRLAIGLDTLAQEWKSFYRLF